MPNVPSSPTAAEDVVERKTNSEIPNNDGSRQEQRLLGAAHLLGHMVEPSGIPPNSLFWSCKFSGQYDGSNISGY